jgi:hypothetical protein
MMFESPSNSNGTIDGGKTGVDGSFLKHANKTLFIIYVRKDDGGSATFLLPKRIFQ